MEIIAGILAGILGGIGLGRRNSINIVFVSIYGD